MSTKNESKFNRGPRSQPTSDTSEINTLYSELDLALQEKKDILDGMLCALFAVNVLMSCHPIHVSLQKLMVTFRRKLLFSSQFGLMPLLVQFVSANWHWKAYAECTSTRCIVPIVYSMLVGGS